jgi:hypothetical protein
MQIKLFESHNIRLVEDEANKWLRMNPNIEVLKIEPAFPVRVYPPNSKAWGEPYEHRFVLTIWYREEPKKPA